MNNIKTLCISYLLCTNYLIFNLENSHNLESYGKHQCSVYPRKSYNCWHICINLFRGAKVKIICIVLAMCHHAIIWRWMHLRCDILHRIWWWNPKLPSIWCGSSVCRLEILRLWDTGAHEQLHRVSFSTDKQPARAAAAVLSSVATAVLSKVFWRPTRR